MKRPPSKDQPQDSNIKKSVSLKQSVGEAIRRLRDRQRMSVRTLADKCGFSPSFISQVELNQASPSLASLERIASGLGATLGEFFIATEPTSPQVLKSSERPVLQSGWSRSQIESLGRTGTIEAILVTMDRGGTSGSRLHARDTDIFAMVLAGRLTVELPNGTQVLRRGDTITIPGGSPHLWQNKGTKAARLLKISAR